MHETLELSFNIPCPENILWWLICMAFIGTLITGVMMLQAARFTLTRDGMPVSIQKFHRVAGAKKASDILSDMSINARTSMRRGVKIDFYCTPFFYGLMICLSILARGNANLGTGWENILLILCWAPLATWVFDLLEDSATLSLLNSFEKKREVAGITTVVMMVCSLLKWTTGIAWLLIMVSLGVACAVANWG